MWPSIFCCRLIHVQHLLPPPPLTITCNVARYGRSLLFFLPSVSRVELSQLKREGRGGGVEGPNKMIAKNSGPLLL
jgi:hypothetical protein